MQALPQFGFFYRAKEFDELPIGTQNEITKLADRLALKETDIPGIAAAAARLELLGIGTERVLEAIVIVHEELCD